MLRKAKNPKVLGIIALSCTALLLLAANLFMPSAKADSLWANRDYTAVTAKLATGDDGLYVTDNFSGQLAIFGYDPTARSLRLRAAPVQLQAVFGTGH